MSWTRDKKNRIFNQVRIKLLINQNESSKSDNLLPIFLRIFNRYFQAFLSGISTGIFKYFEPDFEPDFEPVFSNIFKCFQVPEIINR